MLRSMFAAVSGLQAHQTFMDVVGNNIANVNTTGYKAGTVDVRGPAQPDDERRGRAGRPRSPAVPTRPRSVSVCASRASSTNFSQGATQQTGRSTDFAIQGDGFFVVDQGGMPGVHPQRQLLARRSSASS